MGRCDATMSELLSVSEAQRFILKDFKPTEPQKLPLEQAFRRILAEDIFSSLDLPLFANSSMDGFAVHASDIASSNARASGYPEGCRRYSGREAPANKGCPWSGSSDHDRRSPPCRLRCGCPHRKYPV
jgi:hypothetical protein